MPYYPTAAGDSIAGTYRQRLDLASGRFAMIDDGLGFSLVPWSSSLEQHFGRQVSELSRSAELNGAWEGHMVRAFSRVPSPRPLSLSWQSAGPSRRSQVRKLLHSDMFRTAGVVGPSLKGPALRCLADLSGRPLSFYSYAGLRRSRLSSFIDCARIALSEPRPGSSGLSRYLAGCRKCPRSFCNVKTVKAFWDKSIVLQDLNVSGFGAALLRFILACFWIAHWWYKVGYRGMAATKAFFLQQACLFGSHGSMSGLRSSWRLVSFSGSMCHSYA